MAVAGLAGLLVIPLLIVLYFAAKGGLDALWYANIKHNASSADGDGLAHWYLLVLPLLIGAPAVWAMRRFLPRDRLTLRRIFFVLLTGILLASMPFWPAISRQSYLVIYPSVAVLVAAAAGEGLFLWASAAGRVPISQAVGLALVGLLISGIEGGILLARVPWHSNLTGPLRMWQDVLRLTEPGEKVMDLKGELIFRPRAYYYVFETMTDRLITQGFLRDEVPERLIETRTCVASLGRLRLPPRAKAFLDANYISVGTLRVAGKRLGEPPRGDPIRFEVQIPTDYVILAGGQPAKGMLDSQLCEGPRSISAGWHEYQPASGENELVLLWSRAWQRGFRPGLLRATNVE